MLAISLLAGGLVPTSGPSSFLILYAGVRAGQGIANALANGASLVLLMRNTDRATVADAIGLDEVAAGLGVLIGPLLGGLTGRAQRDGVSWPFVIAAVLVAPAIMATQLAGEHLQVTNKNAHHQALLSQRPPGVDADGTGMRTLGLLSRPEARLAGLTQALALASVGLVEPVLQPLIATAPFHVGSFGVSLVLCGAVISYIGAAASSGLVQNRIGSVGTAAVGLWSSAIGLLLLAASPMLGTRTQAVGVVVVSTGLILGGSGLATPTSVPRLLDAIGLERSEEATVASVIQQCNSLGCATGAFTVGVTVTAFGGIPIALEMGSAGYAVVALCHRTRTRLIPLLPIVAMAAIIGAGVYTQMDSGTADSCNAISLACVLQPLVQPFFMNLFFDSAEVAQLASMFSASVAEHRYRAEQHYHSQRSHLLGRSRHRVHPYFAHLTQYVDSPNVSYWGMVDRRFQSMARQMVDQRQDGFRLEKDKCAMYRFFAANQLPHIPPVGVWTSKAGFASDLWTRILRQNGSSLQWPLFVKMCHLTQGFAKGTARIPTHSWLVQHNEELMSWLEEKWSYRADDRERSWRAAANSLTDTLAPGIMLQSSAPLSWDPLLSVWQVHRCPSFHCQPKLALTSS